MKNYISKLNLLLFLLCYNAFHCSACPPEVKPPKLCGPSTFPNGTSKIMNGKQAKPGWFPWTATVINERKVGKLCGAVLIRAQMLLTSIRCLNEIMDEPTE